MTNAAEPHGRSYAGAGFRIGCMSAVLLWVFPFPIALVVWLLRLKGLFADYMYMAIPFLLVLPFLGGIIGLFIEQSGGYHD